MKQVPRLRSGIVRRSKGGHHKNGRSRGEALIQGILKLREKGEKQGLRLRDEEER